MPRTGQRVEFAWRNGWGTVRVPATILRRHTDEAGKRFYFIVFNVGRTAFAWVGDEDLARPGKRQYDKD